MKLRLRYILLALVVTATFFQSSAQQGHVFKDGDIWYRITNDFKAAVIRVPVGEENKYTGSINIPHTVVGGGMTLQVAEIADSAFCNTSIYEVTLPPSLMKIGVRSFYNTNLEELTFPNSPMLQSIGEEAFSHNEYLEKVTFTSMCAPQDIDYKTFMACETLSEFVVPGGNPHYFSYKGLLYRRGSTGSAELLCCPYTIENPEIYDNCTAIGEGAFYEHNNLLSVTIPDKVTSIGKEAFALCKKLRNIRIGDGVESIPENCFYSAGEFGSYAGSSNFKVKLGKRVKRLEDRSFYWANLISMEWNDSLEFIGNRVFEENIDFMLRDYNRELVLPASVRHIGNRAFNGTAMTKVTIRPEIVYGDAPFSNCDYLRTIEIAEGVKELTPGMFMSSGIYTVSIPASLEKIGKNAFQQCSDLYKIEVAPGSKHFTIKDYVLFTKDMKKLVQCPLSNREMKVSKYVVPDGVEEIETAAFATISFIKELEFPSSLQIINPLACGRMGVLESADLSKTSIKSIPERVFDGNNEMKRLLVPDCVEEILTSALSGCKKLEEFTMPQSVRTIGANAFTSAFFSSPVGVHIDFPEGLESVGDSAFKGAWLSGSVTIPETVTQLGFEPFAQAKIQDTLTINASIEIPHAAFVLNSPKKVVIGPNVPGLDSEICFTYGTGSIEELVISEGLTYMGNSNFPGIYRSLTLPNSLERFGYQNFNNPNLEEITLGSGLTIIGFLGSTPSLKTIRCLATTPPEVLYDPDYGNYFDWNGNIVDEGLYSTVTLYVPAESVELYQNAEVWNRFFKIEADTSMVEDLISSEPRVYAEGRTIHVDESDSPVSVFDVAGQPIFSGCSNEIEVQQTGIYLVKIENKTYKIIVR